MLFDIMEIAKVKKNAIGIDFGTTNSVIARIFENSIQIIAEVPSIVNFYEDGSMVVGHIQEDCVYIRSIKSLFGKGIRDIESVKESLAASSVLCDVLVDDEEIKLAVYGKLFSAIDIASEILKHIKQSAEYIIGESIELAVMTIPAHFDENSRRALLKAAALANIEVLRIISEPTAAAYAYGLEKQSFGEYLVYDLGGGTFDV